LVEEEYDRFDLDYSFRSERKVKRTQKELKAADTIFVPSEFVEQSFLKHGWDRDSLRVIPFGVDTNVYTPGSGKSERNDEFTALYVGEVRLRKGVQYLLSAWQKANVDGRLVIAGTVHDESKPTLSEYEDDPTIEVKGWVDDLVSLYQNSDVFVFPSIEEGSALVTYEAMATGLPLIVTPNAGSLVDENTGREVPIRDTEALSASIEHLATHESKRRRMGQAARNKIESYTWTDYGDRVAEAYMDIIDS